MLKTNLNISTNLKSYLNYNNIWQHCSCRDAVKTLNAYQIGCQTSNKGSILQEKYSKEEPLEKEREKLFFTKCLNFKNMLGAFFPMRCIFMICFANMLSFFVEKEQTTSCGRDFQGLF